MHTMILIQICVLVFTVSKIRNTFNLFSLTISLVHTTQLQCAALTYKIICSSFVEFWYIWY